MESHRYHLRLLLVSISWNALRWFTQMNYFDVHEHFCVAFWQRLWLTYAKLFSFREIRQNRRREKDRESLKRSKENSRKEKEKSNFFRSLHSLTTKITQMNIHSLAIPVVSAAFFRFIIFIILFIGRINFYSFLRNKLKENNLVCNAHAKSISKCFVEFFSLSFRFHLSLRGFVCFCFVLWTKMRIKKHKLPIISLSVLPPFSTVWYFFAFLLRFFFFCFD